jgi:hypothetical protein
MKSFFLAACFFPLYVFLPRLLWLTGIFLSYMQGPTNQCQLQ